MGNRMFTRDNAFLTAVLSWPVAAALLFMAFGVRDIRQVVVWSTIASGLVWLVSKNLVRLDPDHFLVAENLTEVRTAEGWIERSPEDWIQRGPYRIVKYNGCAGGYAWLPIWYARRNTFFAGKTALKPLVIRGAVTADYQIVEIELDLSYKLDSSTDTLWTPDKLEKGFRWKELAREAAEKGIRSLVTSLELRNILDEYREGTLRGKLEDALNAELTTALVILEVENVLILTATGTTYSAIMSSLTEDQRRQVQEIRVAVKTGRIRQLEMMRVLEEIEATLRAIRDGHLVASLDPAVRGELREMTDSLTGNDLTVAQKLKLTVPIIPFVLKWEAEIGNKIGLVRLWKMLTNR